jgi:glycosyltransferase involved in cell wall biosynthesis
MKILFTSIDPVEIGRGHYTHIKELVEGFEKRGVQVTMLFGYDGNPAIKSTGRFIDTGARLERKDSISDFINQYLSILFIKKHLKRYQRLYDLIYGRDWIVGEVSNILTIPSVSEFNGIASQLRVYKKQNLLNTFYSALLMRREKRALISSSRIICVSYGIMQSLKKRVSLNHHGKMHVIENGVNLNRYIVGHHKSYDERIKIVFIGSFAYWHGIEYIAPTILPILAKYDDVDLLLIGEGPKLKNLKHQFGAYANSGRVEYAGRIPMEEASQKLCQCHIGFAPHKNGVLGSPLKIREYCAAGLAQVTSKIQGTQFLAEKRLGILVTPGDISGFQSALEGLLQNRAIISEMGIKARQYAEDFLDWDSKIDKICEVCNAALN